MEFWIFFDFLKSFRRLDPPWNTGQKTFLEKITPKHVQNTFGQFGNDFGRFWNFEKFLNLYKDISIDSTLHGTLGKKNFSKKFTPKHVQNKFWDTFGNDFGTFLEFCKISWFFETISKTRPSMEHYAKRNLRKKYPKTCSKHFWTIWERLLEHRAFLEFWLFLILFKNISKTRPSMEHWAKKFSKKVPQNLFKTRLGTFGNNFRHLRNFENFLIY